MNRKVRHIAAHELISSARAVTANSADLKSAMTSALENSRENGAVIVAMADPRCAVFGIGTSLRGRRTLVEVPRLSNTRLPWPSDNATRTSLWSPRRRSFERSPDEVRRLV